MSVESVIEMCSTEFTTRQNVVKKDKYNTQMQNKNDYVYGFFLIVGQLVCPDSMTMDL